MALLLPMFMVKLSKNDAYNQIPHQSNQKQKWWKYVNEKWTEFVIMNEPFVASDILSRDAKEIYLLWTFEGHQR